MNKTNTYKLLDLIKQLVEKVNTNANNINILAREIAKLKKAKQWNIVKDHCAILTIQRIGNEDQKEISKIKLEEEVVFII